VISGDRGGQGVGPSLPIHLFGNVVSKNRRTSEPQCGGAPSCWKLTEVTEKKCIPRSFLVINICNQGKTLCSPCRMCFVWRKEYICTTVQNNKQWILCLVERHTFVRKVGPSLTTKLYFILLSNFCATCSGTSTVSGHQETEHQIKVIISGTLIQCRSDLRFTCHIGYFYHINVSCIMSVHRSLSSFYPLSMSYIISVHRSPSSFYPFSMSCTGVLISP
jgi:hypothetical protein